MTISSRSRDSSYRRGKRRPAAVVRLGVAYCGGFAFGGRLRGPRSGPLEVIDFADTLGRWIVRSFRAPGFAIAAFGFASALTAATFTVTTTADKIGRAHV